MWKGRVYLSGPGVERPRVIVRTEDVHRRAQGLPALESDWHHEPPLVTVPLPLLPVVGAVGVDCRLLLLLVEEVELELAVVSVVVAVVSAVPPDDDFPA